MRIPAILLASALSVSGGAASAFTIDFGFGLFQNLPYSEENIDFAESAPINSAVFPNSFGGALIGNDPNSGWLGFAEDNVITLTSAFGGLFDITSLDIGPSTIGGGEINVTFTGYKAGLNLSYSLYGLDTLTNVALNWTDLTSFTIVANDDAGIDNVVGNVTDPGTPAVPLPASLPLLLAGVGALAARKRRG